MVGSAHFSSMDFKSGFWQIKMAPGLQQYTAFTVGNLGFFEFTHMPFRVVQRTRNILASHAEHLGGAEPHILCDLPG